MSGRFDRIDTLPDGGLAIVDYKTGKAPSAKSVAAGYSLQLGLIGAIAQAGGGILVDNQPISSPYAVVAVGPPHAMADAFDRSSGLQRLRLLESSYGVRVTVAAGDGLTLPAGSVRDLTFAKGLP